VILLRVIAGLDCAYIARFLGKTPGAVPRPFASWSPPAGRNPDRAAGNRGCEPISRDRPVVDTLEALPYASGFPQRRPAPDPPSNVRAAVCARWLLSVDRCQSLGTVVVVVEGVPDPAAERF
jgi:hypothetical protein